MRLFAVRHPTLHDEFPAVVDLVLCGLRGLLSGKILWQREISVVVVQGRMSKDGLPRSMMSAILFAAACLTSLLPNGSFPNGTFLDANLTSDGGLALSALRSCMVGGEVNFGRVPPRREKRDGGAKIPQRPTGSSLPVRDHQKARQPTLLVAPHSKRIRQSTDSTTSKRVNHPSVLTGISPTRQDVPLASPARG